MAHYRDRGWKVTDTRQNRPYDAVAVRDRETIYLEAKGTQSKGATVIVTRNEVEHARQNPGLCIMGVWSGMRLLDGVVDSEAGDFKILPFNPEERQLRPRDFRLDAARVRALKTRASWAGLHRQGLTVAVQVRTELRRSLSPTTSIGGVRPDRGPGLHAELHPAPGRRGPRRRVRVE